MQKMSIGWFPTPPWVSAPDGAAPRMQGVIASVKSATALKWGSALRKGPAGTLHLLHPGRD